MEKLLLVCLTVVLDSGHRVICSVVYCPHVSRKELLGQAVCVCVCACVHAFAHACACVCTCVCVHVHVCVHACTHVHACTCACMYTYVCACMHVSVWMCLWLCREILYNVCVYVTLRICTGKRTFIMIIAWNAAHNNHSWILLIYTIVVTFQGHSGLNAIMEFFLFFCCGFESFEKLLFMCLTVVLDSGQRFIRLIVYCPCVSIVLDSGQRFIRLIVYCPCVTRKEFLSNVNQETSK